MNALIDKYLGIEKLVVEFLKEVLWLSLVLFLAYRILAEVPVEGPFDDWARTILLTMGYAMIPGVLMKMYTLFTRKWD